MAAYFGTTGMWYKDGVFYELEDRHINYFLKHPEILGFTQKEKKELCLKNGLEADAEFCDEPSAARDNILTEVLKRGAVRIRFYRNQTSVQCGSIDDPMNLLEIRRCIASGWKNCFGNVVQAMDVYGWNEMVSDMGYGIPVEDFCGDEGKGVKYYDTHTIQK